MQYAMQTYEDGHWVTVAESAVPIRSLKRERDVLRVWDRVRLAPVCVSFGAYLALSDAVLSSL